MTATSRRELFQNRIETIRRAMDDLARLKDAEIAKLKDRIRELEALLKEPCPNYRETKQRRDC